jgi:hypothetical protein
VIEDKVYWMKGLGGQNSQEIKITTSWEFPEVRVHSACRRVVRPRLPTTREGVECGGQRCTQPDEKAIEKLERSLLDYNGATGKAFGDVTEKYAFMVISIGLTTSDREDPRCDLRLSPLLLPSTRARSGSEWIEQNPLEVAVALQGRPNLVLALHGLVFSLPPLIVVTLRPVASALTLCITRQGACLGA